MRCAALLVALMLTHAAAADVTNLTHTAGVDERWPDWQHSGGRIAFSREVGGQSDVFTVALDGSDEQRLTDYLGEDFQPAWSPDGRFLAFVSKRVRGVFHLFVLEPATGAIDILAPDLGGFDLFPDWSSDGEWIVFSHLSTGLAYDLFRVHPDGSGLEQLTDTPASETNPSWSPDGSRLACANDGSVWILKLGDGTRREVGRGEQPAWSPQGDRIAFISGGSTIVLVDPDSEQADTVAVNGWSVMDVEWSPDAASLVVSAEVGGRDLIVVPLTSLASAVSPVGWGQHKRELLAVP